MYFVYEIIMLPNTLSYHIGFSHLCSYFYVIITFQQRFIPLLVNGHHFIIIHVVVLCDVEPLTLLHMTQ